jgi:hypothetical protein
MKRNRYSFIEKFYVLEARGLRCKISYGAVENEKNEKEILKTMVKTYVGLAYMTYLTG